MPITPSASKYVFFPAYIIFPQTQKAPLRRTIKWSLRIGDHGIIYVIDENEKTVILYNLRHRKLAYR